MLSFWVPFRPDEVHSSGWKLVFLQTMYCSREYQASTRLSQQYEKSTSKTIKGYQVIQNTCAKLVLGTPKYSSSTEALQCMYWLPIQQRITYKIGLISFKCINKAAPKYLQELITIRKPTQENMWSNNTSPIHKTFAVRSFKYAGPKTWHSFPKQIRTCNNLTKLKSLLKTYLYKEAFNIK